MTEATHFSQCVHDQQRRLEAEDCDSIRCAQLISGGRRRIRPPCTVPRSRSPHNVLHSPSLYGCFILGVNTLYVCDLHMNLDHFALSHICDNCPVRVKTVCVKWKATLKLLHLPLHM